MDPGLPFYQGPKPVFDTNLQKTDTIVLRKPLYAARLAGIGIQWAPKKPLLAPFGATISGRNDPQYVKTGKTPVFTMPGSRVWEDPGRGTRTCLPVSKANLKTEVSSLTGIVIISLTVNRSKWFWADNHFFLIGCKKWRIPVHGFWN